MRRIEAFLTAEDLPKPYDIKDDVPSAAIDADGDFTWETVRAINHDESEKSKKKAASKETGSKKNSPKNGAAVLPQHTDSEKSGLHEDEDEKVKPEVEEEKPFQLKNMKLTVPRGAFVGIVGRVGSGKVDKACPVHIVPANMSNDRRVPCFKLYLAR